MCVQFVSSSRNYCYILGRQKERRIQYDSFLLQLILFYYFHCIGIDDIEELYDVLVVKGSPKISFSWQALGAYLGLLNNTLQRIQSSYLEEEKCLRECLLYWLRRYDCVDDRGGPTCDSLEKALKDIKADEIAKQVVEKFKPKREGKF